MIATLIFILILSLLIVVHEFGHFIVARKNGVRVEKFSLGFGKRIYSRKKGDTEYSLNLVPLGGYVKMAGDNLEECKGKSDEYFSKPPGKRFQIIVSGALLNYLLGFVFFWLIFCIGYPALTTKIGGLVDGFGAQSAGLKAGDQIRTVEGRKVGNWNELQKEIQRNSSASSVNIMLLREGKELEVAVPLKEKSAVDDLGQKRSLTLIGITPFDEIVEIRHGPLESIFLAGQKTLDLTITTYKGLWFLATGRISMRESMAGPLEIFFMTSRAASLGLVAVLHLIAALSISLAIFNLLPVPVLDGGHVLLLGIEKVRGKPLGAGAERVLTNIGFSLLLTLVVLVTYNDILRRFGENIGKFIAK
ncbi:MAG: RIP metalloprotease RseP [Candidatus Omnitrophica bacterium]|nr:RIP metalloprotease RseP [Candidatus Omnitrophota bacterium]